MKRLKFDELCDKVDTLFEDQKTPKQIKTGQRWGTNFAPKVIATKKDQSKKRAERRKQERKAMKGDYD